MTAKKLKAEVKHWYEPTHGTLSNYPDRLPSAYRNQIKYIECAHCDFRLEPSEFRRYNEFRTEHPGAYGNFASIAHARKVMREHVWESHPKERALAEGGE